MLLYSWVTHCSATCDALSIIIIVSPLSQVNANWMAFPPHPQKASTIKSHRHLSAICSAIFSGVTEYQDSEKQYNNQIKAMKILVQKNFVPLSNFIPSSNLENNLYLCAQYFIIDLSLAISGGITARFLFCPADLQFLFFLDFFVCFVNGLYVSSDK